MAENFRIQIERVLAEYSAERDVDHYLELFPELDCRLSKFAAGIYQWNMEGKIDIENPDDVSRVRMILKVLDYSPAFDFFDQCFNDCSPEAVCEILGMSPNGQREEPEMEYDYTVIPINSFEEAKEYSDMVSWCIVISKEAFDDYTKGGSRFYFLRNKDWQEVKSVPGRDFPYDQYGYSLIAVEMSSDNKIVSVTSRWNECSENSGKFLNESQLKEILGDKYGELMIDE